MLQLPQIWAFQKRMGEVKARLGELTDVAVTLLHPQAAGDQKMQLSRVLVLCILVRKTKRKTPPTTTNKALKKNKFRETSNDKSSWLVYSSYSNHELLHSFFRVF